MEKYREFILFRSQASPSIRGLVGYTTLPTATANAPRLTLLDYLGDAAVPEEPKPVEDLAELPSLLNRPAPNLRGQVLLVENITPHLVNLLGSTLGIDPAFFAGHITADFQDLETAPPPPSIAILPNRTAEKGFLHVHYQLIVDLDRSSAFEKSPYALQTDSNVRRSIRRLQDLSGRQLGIARGCCSLVVTTYGRHWVCLILTDPPIKVAVERLKPDGRKMHPSRPLHGGFEDFMAPTSFSSFEKASRTDPWSEEEKNCMLDSLVRYLSKDGPRLATAAAAPSPDLILAFSYYPIRIALAHWVMYTQLTSRFLKYYEYSLSDVGARLHKDLVDLQRWRRRCKQSIYKVESLAVAVNYWLHELDRGAPKEDDYSSCPARVRYWESVLQDIGQINAQLQGYNKSLELMIPVATSMVQLMDARESLLHASNTTRLTYIALIFVPLSWVASIFSMTDEYQPGREKFWVYFAIGLPLVLVILLASTLRFSSAKALGRIWLGVKGFWGTSGGYVAVGRRKLRGIRSPGKPAAV
ncbi:hypothetical protein MAPG_11664 [Magnaporthiopsis poae ATCC 64411]|uniref:CorA family metal ion transporter n=1 Tax=Magnaporthiopsis poae (strain ATCC 64411 / 73-15) TaxID=644358 RepID=A0A0C4EFV5_MAGP6|nr:hypothetical protein MAPG_11664 [Magnaporthiopsis poae ATCC 64411]